MGLGYEIQWIGLREFLQENHGKPISTGKIYGFL